MYRYIYDLKNYLWTCQICTPLSDVFYFCWHIRTIFTQLFPETPLKESVTKIWIMWPVGKVTYYLLSKPEHSRKQGGTIDTCAGTTVKSHHCSEQTKCMFAPQGRGSTFSRDILRWFWGSCFDVIWFNVWVPPVLAWNIEAPLPCASGEFQATLTCHFVLMTLMTEISATQWAWRW